MASEGGRSPSDTLGAVYAAWNEMVEGESAALPLRVAALEAKCARQAEELLCLRSTLADALRRLAAIEAQPLSRPGSGAPTPTPTHSSRELRLRHGTHRDAKRTTSYGSASSLPHRRGPQHQSTGSLQSDSPASSSSLSPAPSPSPRATPAPPAPHHPAPHPARSRNDSTSSQQGACPGAAAASQLTRRWNSTGDFGAQGFIANARFTTKSLLNLYAKPHQNGPMPKHGTHTWQYLSEEGAVRMFLRGRPVLLHAPAEMAAPLESARVAPPPSAKLKLEWVHGYRGKDCRSNLYLLPTGEIVYFVAAVVVLFNVDEQSQRHYTAHSDDVRCLALHPNKLLLASGQCAGHADARPHVRVWDSVSLATLAVLAGPHLQRSVACVAFSRGDGGSLLACVDDAHDHALSVWEWRRAHCLAETKCSVDTVVAAEFHPLERAQLVTCGKNHIAFWTLDQGNVLYKRLGVFERDKPRYVTCLAFNHSGDVVSGDSSGNVIVWARGTNTVARLVRAVHEGAVFALCALKDGGVLTGGGKDGRVVLLSAELAPVQHSVLEGHYGGVRAIAEGRGGRLFVGTTRNCILHGELRAPLAPAVLGHAEEVWALAAHPSLPQYVTAGRDRLLQLWDGLSHSTVWSKDIEERAQSCAWSQDGAVVLVGCDSGKWLVFDPQSRDLLARHQDGCEAIQAVQFSPDGSLVALGSRDNAVYVYQVQEHGRRYSRLGKCSGHSSFVTHLDWSRDGQLLRTNSGDYELLYWNAATCRQVTSAAAVRDARWASATCPVTFEMAGVWPEGADGTDVNSCAAAERTRLAATGDDFGKVKLFAFPVTQPRSLCHAYGGHSAHVTCVRFLPDESRLVSTGGADTSVMQWVVE